MWWLGTKRTWGWEAPEIERASRFIPARRSDASCLPIGVRVVKQCPTRIAGGQDDAGGGGEGPVGQGFQLGIMHEDIVPRLPDVMWSITDSGGEAEGQRRRLRRHGRLHWNARLSGTAVHRGKGLFHWKVCPYACFCLQLVDRLGSAEHEKAPYR